MSVSKGRGKCLDGGVVRSTDRRSEMVQVGDEDNRSRFGAEGSSYADGFRAS